MGQQLISWDLALQLEVISDPLRCFIIVRYKPQFSFLSANPTLPCPASPQVTFLFLLPHFNSTPLGFLFAFCPWTSPSLPFHLYPVILKTQSSFPPLHANQCQHNRATCYPPPTRDHFCMPSKVDYSGLLMVHHEGGGQGGTGNATEGTPKSHKALSLAFGGPQVRSPPRQSPAPCWSCPPSGDRDKGAHGWEKALSPAKVGVTALPPPFLPQRSPPVSCGRPADCPCLRHLESLHPRLLPPSSWPLALSPCRQQDCGPKANGYF